jgi:hypothetical protein
MKTTPVREPHEMKEVDGVCLIKCSTAAEFIATLRVSDELWTPKGQWHTDWYF